MANSRITKAFAEELGQSLSAIFLFLHCFSFHT